mmetsp:Transcript_4958/g.7707  ORF Transcript_4958/g.7707 Transcript_4958/m.7707 type:complete len:130 (-) Transcript_4958:527-916(-)
MQVKWLKPPRVVLKMETDMRLVWEAGMHLALCSDVVNCCNILICVDSGFDIPEGINPMEIDNIYFLTHNMMFFKKFLSFQKNLHAFAFVTERVGLQRMVDIVWLQDLMDMGGQDNHHDLIDVGPEEGSI